MPIPFTCPHCGTTTDVADQYAGQSGPCAHCGKTVIIPPAESQRPRKRGPALGCFYFLLSVVLGCGGLYGLLVSVVYFAEEARKTNARHSCIHNLKRIGWAMHEYNEKFGSFPPAYIPDENGKPKHSWRVLILPFIDPEYDDPDYKLLYAQYHFDEAWNSPHNKALAAKMPELYRCFSDPTAPKPGITNYVMLVGPHAVSDGPTARRKTDITDDPGKTIRVTEVVGTDINWMEPRDLDVDKMTFRIVHPGNQPVTDISSGHPAVAYVLMCDGAVRTLPDDIDPKLLEAMTTIDGGETVDLN